MRLCIIGCSGHYGLAVDATQNGIVECVGMAVADGEDIAPLRTRLPHAAAYDDYCTMLDTVDADAVVVDTRFDLHGEVTLYALERGLHVLCEKPLALDIATVERIERVASERGLIVWSMNTMRYDPWFYTAYCAVRDGLVGDVRMVNARKSYKLGQRSDFYTHRATYGGTIPWVGIHGIDLIHRICGDRFRAVTAYQSTIGNGGHGELEATAAALYALDDGVTATLTADYLRPSAAPSHGDDRLRVVGDKGIVEVTDGVVRVIADTAYVMDLLQPPTLLGDFADAVHGGGSGLFDTSAALYVNRLALLTRDAADRGITVAL